MPKFGMQRDRQERSIMVDQEKPTSFPPQHQERQPGKEADMQPLPQAEMQNYQGSGKLQGKIALVTGGDSGIGRAVAIAYAKEGADVVVAYLNEHEDARQTRHYIEQAGRRCWLKAGDVGDPAFCAQLMQEVMSDCGGQLDILVNNAAEQHPQERLEDISDAQLERTFRTNIFSMFYLTRAALPHLKEGARIINTTSVTAYRGSSHLLDYSATKGAIVAFTRSLSQQLASGGILVNAVAPGPVWTPLIPSTFPADAVAQFGSSVPLGRAGQPDEIAPSYVFLASDGGSYMTGQVLHPNGGEVVNA
jgi:NAD(P)-dependent dehydrogenase (short-subunit alcohol dehydrogenase family)